MGIGGTPTRRPLLAAALCAIVGLAAGVGDATAQWWPWSKQDDGPPIPRERMREPRGQPDRQPPLQPDPRDTQRPSFGARSPSNLCLQLEQRLVAEVQGSSHGRDLLPQIEADMRNLERTMRTASIRLDRSDCWDTFLFSKTLRPSRRCRQLNDEVESARQRLADLDRQRRQIMGSGDTSLQDEIIRELARNGCGSQYAREARKRDNANNPFALLFGGGEEEMDGPRGPTNKFGNLPFATYRTLCVRLCDGYYFPVSFSTLPNHFQRDAEVCQSQCAAPAELFYHQNPGGSVEQMMSFGSQTPYTSLKAAFRYRKEYVPGCSCKQAEYNPAVEGLEKKAEAEVPPPAVPVGGVRIGAKR